MTRRTYTDAERAEALALYETDGPTAVQEKLGIAKATVSDWARKANVRTRSEATKRANVAAMAARWEERRGEMVHRMGEVAELALGSAESNLLVGRAREAKDAATTMAILVDKAQLLSGAPVSRHELTGKREEVLDAARDGALRLVS